MAPAAKQQKKLTKQKEGKLKTNLYMAVTTKNITTYFFGTILVQNGLLCTTSMTVLCPSWSYKGTTPPSA